jgi:hypothetical protein
MRRPIVRATRTRSDDVAQTFSPSRPFKTGAAPRVSFSHELCTGLLSFTGSCNESMAAILSQSSDIPYPHRRFRSGREPVALWTERRGAPCFNVVRTSPLRALHTRAVPSAEVLTTRSPCGLNAAEMTACPCCVVVDTNCPEVAFLTLAVRPGKYGDGFTSRKRR